MTSDPVHRAFLERLDSSQSAVAIIREWLRTRGTPAKQPSFTRAPEARDWREHSDAGDLLASVRVEVKQLSRDFTGAHDWPFRDIIVSSVHSWDDAHPKPWRYFYLNREGTHALCISGLQSDAWTQQTRGVSHLDGAERLFYICPLDLGRFVALT